MTVIAVAFGGALGATLRYLVGLASMRLLGPGFPWGTVAVNVLGSFAMGLIAVMLVERFPGAWNRWAPFLLTGILGGFTTFSAFSLDAVFLMERGRLVAAVGYVGLSVVGSVLALALGMWFARSWS
ncbi:MAG: fluoride efflux transporter CrcB [Pseudomonadota bacterium]